MSAPADWQTLLRGFKERLAKRLWALPTVTETEKEMVYKEYLKDLDEFERALSDAEEKRTAVVKTSKDESELLRSLLGVSEDDLKIQALTLAQDKKNMEETVSTAQEELGALRKQAAESSEENEHLRKRLHEFQAQAEQFRLQQMKVREDDIKFYSDHHEALKNQLKDLESRLGNLKVLFADANQKYLSEKQEEISGLQRKLLEEMEAALRQKQELSWTEEEMFAQGVAHRVRTALVSAQGQLMLTLERLGLVDAESKNEAFWKSRLKLLIEGGAELSRNFHAIQAQLQEVTSTLDDYLHLTHRRQIGREPVSLRDVVQREMAELYAERQPTLQVEFLPDDPLPDVPGDTALIRFVVKELLKNALEAIPNQVGRITVALKNRSDKGVVEMLVKDSGTGIAAHLTPRLFQPFFSTKQNRQGLSLSRAKRYVEFHGGSMQLINSGPTGTTFQVDLPLTNMLLQNGNPLSLGGATFKGAA